MNSISLKIPDYFHREYSNDINHKVEDSTVLKQCKRMTLIALPFISLYKPAGMAISLGMGSCRALSDAVNLYGVTQVGTQQEILDQLLQTAVSITSIVCTILIQPLGMFVTTGQDLTIEAFALVNHVQKGEYGQAIESVAKIVNNTLYLCMFVGGGVELSIASLAMQVLIGLYQSRKELLNENYPEAIGHLAMAMIRGNQMLGQVHTLQLKWEADANLEEQKIVNLKKMSSTIEELQKELAEEAVKLETLQQDTTARSDYNSELLEFQKIQLIELEKKLLDAQHLQKILVSYGNNTENLPAFHYAIKRGDKEAVELMLKYGVSVESIASGFDKSYHSISGITALHQAALSGQPEIVDLLLQNGADINARSFDIGPSLSLGVIHYAAKSGNAEVINRLVKGGVNIDMSSINDPYEANTALHIAAELGSFDVIAALVNGGADVNKGRVPRQYSSWLMDRHGSPLDKAVSTLKYSDNPKNLDLIKFLVENGAQRRYQRYDHMLCPIIKEYLESVGR